MTLPERSPTPPTRPHVELIPFLLLAIAALCWAGNHVIGRWVAAETPPVPPGGLSAMRWLLAIVVLLPFAWRQVVADWPRLRERAGVVVFLGAMGGALFSFLQYYALRHTTAINIGVLNSVAPALIIVAGAVIFRDRVRAAQLAGIAVSLAGVLVIISQGMFERLTALRFNAGDLLGLTTMSIWAIYSTCLRMKPDVHGLTFMLAVSVVGLIGNIPVMLIEMASGEVLRATWITLGAVLYVGLFSSVIAYLSWTAGVTALGSQRAGAFLHLVPLFSAVLSIVVLGERPFLFHAVGLALIVVGVTIAVRRPATAH